MTQFTDVIRAINADPARLEAFLTKNPGVTQMLAIALGVLHEYPTANLSNAVAVLPKAPAPTAQPHGVEVALADSRSGFNSHRAYLFSVAPSEGTVEQELTRLLGKAAAGRIAEDWGERCSLATVLKKETHIALFIHSNYRARSRIYAEEGAKTTQEDDFQSTGYEFSDDVAATLLCARLVKKASRNDPQLSEAERELYAKLQEGTVRTWVGALFVDLDGCLRAEPFRARGGANHRAFGSPLPSI